MNDPLAPGSVIGILGGGQLGRMLALAAARLGLKVHVFDPVAGGPAAQVSAFETVAGFDDVDAIRRFAGAVDVVTYEFENIPDTALNAMDGLVPVRPGRQALVTSQDRLVEKDFLAGIGLDVAPYRNVESAEDLARAIKEIGPEGILKTRRFGYDGKGQVRLRGGEDHAQIYGQMSGAPCILEGLVPFSTEISVIAARGMDGKIACFDPGENLHEDGILRRTTVPAAVPRRLLTDAVLVAGRIVNALDYVGVMGIELFVVPSGLIVNEIAPRVHNSGHWTQNACAVDQFEQHIRAVAGWPLSRGERHSDCVMENLIGDEVDSWRKVIDDGLHLYGKAEARPGRKMGHINRITPVS